MTIEYIFLLLHVKGMYWILFLIFIIILICLAIALNNVINPIIYHTKDVISLYIKSHIYNILDDISIDDNILDNISYEYCTNNTDIQFYIDLILFDIVSLLPSHNFMELFNKLRNRSLSLNREHLNVLS